MEASKEMGKLIHSVTNMNQDTYLYNLSDVCFVMRTLPIRF